MIRLFCAIAMLLSLSGCIGALYVAEGVAAVATIADDVLGIDVSLKQSNPNKTPIGAVVHP
jgi:hypothetical protein